MIDKRAIFPILMFAMAGLSFAFGAWQYWYAQKVLASGSQRMAYIMTTLEQSNIASGQKQQLYASIANGLPSAPHLFGIDVSGSFARQTAGDQCANDGQRAICRALEQQSDSATMMAVCGVCNPQ